MRNVRWAKMKMVMEKRGYAIAILIAALCLPAGPSYSKGSNVKFQFNPPPDFTYVESATVTKIRSSKSSPEIKDVARIRAKVTITESPRGYYQAVKTLSAEMTRNGRPVAVPMLDMMSSIELTYDIDREGPLQDVYGYDALFENFRKALSPPAFEALSAVLNQEVLVKKEKADWNARIGSFVGRKVKIGDILLANEPYTLPTGGEITLQRATQVRDWAPCHAKDKSKNCVLLAF